MRYIVAILVVVTFASAVFFSCKKWQDPAPVDNSNINNPYCNDPDAVNYNWGFPGKPDNTVCFYPSDLFQGTYILKDTILGAQSDLFLKADSLLITITKKSKTQVVLNGLCPSGKELLLSANASYTATIDTTVGDSLTLNPGQFFCRDLDTVAGALALDKADSSLVYLNFTVVSDTGKTIYSGRAIKQQ